MTQLLEELGFWDFSIFYDEPAIMEFCRAVGISTTSVVHVRVTAPESPPSNGRVERYHGLIKGITRTLLTALDEHCGETVPRRHILFGWAIRHAAFLYNRYQVHESGMTSYQQVFKKPYISKLAIFGEIVWCKFQKTKGADPIEDRWCDVVWVG